MTKRQTQQAIRKVEGYVAQLVGEIAEVEGAFQRQVGFLKLRLGIAIDEGAVLVAAIGEDWRDWARANVSDETPPTLYRMRNAGSVGSVIGLDAIKPGTSYLALVPFYRFLKAATGEEATSAACETIRALWAECVKRAGDGWVTADLATEVVEASGQATTRGKNAGDAPAAAKSRQAAKSRKRAKSATAEKSDGPIASDDPVQREACARELERLLSKVDESQVPMTRAGMLAGIKLAETFGLGVAFAVVKGHR